jgi:hypothetical protein
VTAKTPVTFRRGSGRLLQGLMLDQPRPPLSVGAASLTSSGFKSTGSVRSKRAGRPRIKQADTASPATRAMLAGAWSPSSLSLAKGRGRDGEEEDVNALIAFLLLLVMLVIGARVRGVRFSFWKLLAFIAACVVVLALLLAMIAG